MNRGCPLAVAVRGHTPAFRTPQARDHEPSSDCNAILVNLEEPLTADQPEVFCIRGKARPHRVGPGDPLKAGRDLGVVQIRVVTALAADELKRAGVAAFPLALLDVGRLAPHAGRIWSSALPSITARQFYRNAPMSRRLNSQQGSRQGTGETPRTVSTAAGRPARTKADHGRRHTRRVQA